MAVGSGWYETKSGSMAPGEVAGKYRILSELGRGGMGVVYLAVDTTLDRRVALKALHPSLSADESFMSGFQREARSVASLQHPCIVRINSLENLDGHLVIDMEYVEGMSLGAYITRQVATPAFVARIADDLFTALETCHNVGVLHRDIKPNNVLLTTECRAKLADFGSATAYANYVDVTCSKNSSGLFLGTPRYAPFEAWEGQPPTPAWDLYSTGMVLYEALTGGPAYAGTTPLALAKEMVTSPVAQVQALTPNVSPEFASFVHRLLERDPASRPQTASQARELLRLVPEYAGDLHGESPTLRVPRIKPRRIRRVLPSAKRRIRRLAVGTGVALALIAVTGFTAWLVRGAAARPKTPATLAAPAPSGQKILPAQETVIQGSILSQDNLMNRPKRSTDLSLRFFDATILEGAREAKARWMMGAPGAASLSAVCATDRGLWHLQMTSGADDTVRFNGRWADYQDDTGTRFREGTVSGSGMWTTPNRALTAALTFTNERDNTSWNTTVSIKRSAAIWTNTQYIAQLEDADLLQPLLYNELLPRGAAWAKQVERLFPCVANARVRVPCLTGKEDITLDGKLTEGVWRREYFDGAGRMGRIVGEPLNEGAVMLLRCVPEGVVIGLKVPKSLDREAGFRVSLLASYGIPMRESGYCLVTARPGRSLDAHYFVGTREAPWNVDWRAAFSSGDNQWEAELLIPTKRLRADAAPKPGVTWRLNCAVIDWQDAAHPKTLYQWGYPVVRQAEHGMVLTFGQPSNES